MMNNYAASGKERLLLPEDFDQSGVFEDRCATGHTAA